MSLKKLLIHDGVVAACRFRDDGAVMDAASLLPEEIVDRLAHFAQWYRRMVSGNTDLLSLFSQMRGWSPSQGWIVQGHAMTVCCIGNVVCLTERGNGSLNALMRALQEIAHE